MRTQTLLSFSNICEEVLYSIATEGPLSENETKIIGHYCMEIFNTLMPRASQPVDSVLPKKH
jgi:hypothetical protein